MEFILSLWNGISALVQPYPGIVAFDFGRYLVAAGLLTGVLLLTSKLYRERRAVRMRLPAANQRQREFAYSAAAAAVFAAVGLGVYHGAVHGLLHIYDAVSDYGWFYWSFSLVLIVVAQDAYFYWTHRLMHRHSLFPWTHRAHHLSVAPTQWAAYAFAPGEALIQAIFLPILLLFVPMHASVIFAWMAHQVLRNVQGHCGVELVPKQWLATWWGRWLTTTLHHDLHHAHGKGNYGLYFTWWDRWCGTEREDYRSRLAMLIDNIERGDQTEAAMAEL
jgi:sterol desaturase/sphingolipid hydroxylase (fatty acid hydroxylase superfamily)